MSYVLIQNRGELPIWGMRLLGLSNKSPEQIGKFGTGLKESIALLARMDNLPIIYSGTCRIDFAVKEENGPPEIHFNLSEEKHPFYNDQWYGLGIHPDFGKADWDDPWMVFRELICNALDESGKDDLYHDVCSDDPVGVEGATRIYIPLKGDVLRAYSDVQDKILLLSHYEIVEEVSDKERVIKKRREPNLQVFHRGIWVQEGTKPSMWDYDLDDVKLNESRSADWYNVNFELARVILKLSPDPAGQLLGKLMTNEGSDLHEHTVLETASRWADAHNCEAWVEAWRRIYGDYAVLTNDDKFFYDRLESQGETPVCVKNDTLHAFLKAVGIPSATDVLSREQQEYEIVTAPSPEAQGVFDRVWRKLEDAGLTMGRPKPALMLFKQRLGVSETVFGEYRNGVCYINMTTTGSIKERQACIEEIAHHVTQAGDYNRAFQNFLVEAIDVLAFGRGVEVEHQCNKQHQG